MGLFLPADTLPEGMKKHRKPRQMKEDSQTSEILLGQTTELFSYKGVPCFKKIMTPKLTQRC